MAPRLLLVARLENQLSITTRTPATLKPDNTRNTAQNRVDTAIGYNNAATAAIAANTANARIWPTRPIILCTYNVPSTKPME